jgi:hypothetical protein
MPYMRVVRGRWPDPDKINSEEARQLVSDLVTAFKQFPGYQSFMGGVDRAGGRTIHVSTWDTEEQARLPPGALSALRPRDQSLGVQVDPPEVFEVTTT